MSTTALETLVSSMALSELALRSGRSVEEIVNWALGGVRAAEAKRGPTSRPAPAKSISSAPSTTPEPTPPARRGGGSKNVNTRTPEGRERYDDAVLALVRGSNGPIAAATIRDRLGGTPLQVRAALNRLIETKQVEYHGRARAMRYTAR